MSIINFCNPKHLGAHEFYPDTMSNAGRSALCTFLVYKVVLKSSRCKEAAVAAFALGIFRNVVSLITKRIFPFHSEAIVSYMPTCLVQVLKGLDGILAWHDHEATFLEGMSWTAMTLTFAKFARPDLGVHLVYSIAMSILGSFIEKGLIVHVENALHPGQPTTSWNMRVIIPYLL